MTRDSCVVRMSKTRMQSSRRATAALAGLILIVLLSACNGPQAASSAPTAAPSATIDPTLQRYAVAVHTYYQSFSDAINDEDNNCRLPKPTPWATCQTLSATVLSTGHALLAQLPATPPPAPLQAVDTALKQAAKAALSAYAQRVPALSAHDGAAFENGNLLIGQAVSQQCDPVNQFNDVAPSGTHIEAPHGQC